MMWLSELISNTSPILSLAGLVFLQLLPLVLALRFSHFKPLLASALLGQLGAFSTPMLADLLRFGASEFVTLPQYSARVLPWATLVTLLVYGVGTLRKKAFFSQSKPTLPEFSLESPLSLFLLGGVCSAVFWIDALPQSLVPMAYATHFVGVLVLYSSRSVHYSLPLKFMRMGYVGLSLVAFLLSLSLLHVGTLLQIWFIDILVKRRRTYVLPGMALLGVTLLLQTAKSELRRSAVSNHAPQKMAALKASPKRLEIVKQEILKPVKPTSQPKVKSHPIPPPTPPIQPKITLKQSKEKYRAKQYHSRLDRIASSLLRVGDDSLETVLTSQEAPFERTEWLPHLLLPRLFWSAKPERLDWNRFGRHYGVLDGHDKQTSVRFHYLTQGYIWAGYVGIFFAALVYGLYLLAIRRGLDWVPIRDRQLWIQAFCVSLLMPQDAVTLTTSLIHLGLALALLLSTLHATERFAGLSRVRASVPNL